MTFQEEFTKQELQTAIDCLKKGKAGDTKGIMAEDLKGCDGETRDLMRDTFNMTLNEDPLTPSAWEKVMIKVIYRRGDPTKPEKIAQFARCRPCTHYYPRGSTTDQVLDQGVFRKNYQTTDHLIAYRFIAQKRRAWRADMCVATVDFQRAFDFAGHVFWKPAS